MSVGGLRDIFGTEWMGRYEEGTPAEDCTGPLDEYKDQYPDDLLRILIVTPPSSPLALQENGAQTYTGPVDTYVRSILVNGEVIEDAVTRPIYNAATHQEDVYEALPNETTSRTIQDEAAVPPVNGDRNVTPQTVNGRPIRVLPDGRFVLGPAA